MQLKHLKIKEKNFNQLKLKLASGKSAKATRTFLISRKEKGYDVVCFHQYCFIA